MTSIQFAELPAVEAPPASDGSAAPVLSDRVLTLRFRLVSANESGLEALRYARRAMLREESTRGVEEGEPSLEEAVFSASEVSWSVPAASAAVCRAKLADLVSRAHRALDAPSGFPAARLAARRA